MTHPFHPLSGKTFDLLHFRQNWGEKRVYYLDASENLASIPACWTDICADDPFIVMARGRSFFKATDLEQLTRLVREIEG
ncbi:MAG: hypothetical protein HQL80_12365 [Magnetococcales bacterium]|nr:hypothetical protein [Magnetococcales bacterium]